MAALRRLGRIGVAVLTAIIVVTTLSALPAQAATPAVAARDARLTVSLDPMPATPYEGEMILATVRGLYDVTIALEKLRQPDLRNFSWMQLGRDEWTSQRIDGREMKVFERRLALYPRAAGTLTIGSFTHHLTLVSNAGDRFVHDVVSTPVTVTVQAKPRTAGNWWLPARTVTLSDEWDMDPAMMANGATATRTVVITAAGVPPAELPPPPKMIADWLIAFMAPEERSVTITDDGPVSTVRWRWRFRPARSEPGKLPAFHIPWFDTRSREMRDIVLRSQRIAFAAIAEPEPAGAAASFLASRVPLLAGLAGFVLVLAPFLWRRNLLKRSDLERRFAWALPDPDERRLKRAARDNDAMGARAAAQSYVARHPQTAGARATGALAELDRQLYSRDGSTAGLNLRSFADRILGRSR